MKKRSLTLSLLVSCCFILFLCSAKSSQAETYVVDMSRWEEPPEVPTVDVDDNYAFYIKEEEPNIYEVWIRGAFIPGKELVLPDNMEYNGKVYPVTIFASDLAVGDKAMQYQTIVFPDSVKRIILGRDCPYVTKINVPKSIETLSMEDIGSKDKKFEPVGPKNVQFVVPDSMEHYTFQNNALYSKKDPGTLVYPLNIPEKYSIAEGTTTLDVGCFSCNCVWRYVRKITCPASIMTVGGNAFSDCSKLETVDMGQTKIKVLKPGTFQRTSSLKKVILPKTLKKTEHCVFDSSGISRLIIPPNVSVIGDRAFWNCKKLKKVTFEGTKKMPKFVSTEVFKHTPSGIKFYVKNKKMAKQLKKRLKKSGVKKAKIYAGKKKKLVYKNING